MFVDKATSSALMDAILQQGIKPHVETLAPIISAGRIGVVVYAPNALGQAAACGLGWDGKTNAFRMNGAARKRMIANLERVGDHVSVRWLRGGRPGRIFVIAMGGTLLVNFEPGVGYSVEPGSTNRGMA